MADQPTVKHPPDPGISARHASKNLPEMAPRHHMDSNQFSEPNLDDLQAGSYLSNTPYGYGGATHSTSTSRIDPMRPNLAKAPKRCSTFSAVNKSSHLNISVTRMVHIKNSSDLSTGRRPKSKSAEFLMCTILVTEILRCENFNFFIHITSFWEFYPMSTCK